MILETEVSWFESTYKTEVKGSIRLDDMLQMVQNGTHGDLIEKLRAGDKTVKQHLPTFAAHGTFTYFRKASNFVESSGVIVLDIDDIEEGDLEDYKESIMEESNHVLAAMVSPSGNGIKVLYLVDPDLIAKDNYRQIGKQVINKFEDYGNVDFLSITDCLIATYDPDIIINEDAEPEYLYVHESTIPDDPELEKRDESKKLWDDAEEFFETVLLDEIAEKTNNNFHFIQVSTLDMAKFGFTHPKFDLSFIIDYSETNFKVSKDNKKRFMEAVEIAKSYSQVKWPYNTTKTEEDDFEEEPNWEEYAKESKPKTSKKTERTNEVEGSDDKLDDETEYLTSSKKNKERLDSAVEELDDDDEETGLIDYDLIFDKVLETIAEGDRLGFEVSFENFAEVFRPKGSGILTVTGIPGSGKTEFVDAVTLDLARLYGHETIVAGFEQSAPEHLIKLMRKMVGADITCPSWNNESKTKEAFDFVTKYFKHIDTNKSGGDIVKILEIAAKHIVKSRAEGGDPKYIVLDPFNMLSIKSKASGHEKIEQILRMLTQFSHQMGILVILVAHPFKMRKDEKTGEYEVPDFYSVKGSSAFFEMSYHGWVVYRKSDGSVMVKILKVKQNNLGTTGAEVFFDYHKSSGRYIPIDEEGNELTGDHYDKGWLDKIIKDN